MADDKGCTEDMWTPYKELENLVERYVTSAPSADDPQYHEFMEALRNHRQNFLSLMKNPPKNTESREEIRRGATEGITLAGLGHHVLSKELVDETLIISDMYDLNEFMALDLLCTAQLQMPHHPGLTRGLTAVLLYYDGRKALTSALRTLVQARYGRSWVLDTPLALTKRITEYTNKMRDDGLLDRVLSLLEEMDPTAEQDMLQQNRALGGAKHHRTVMRLYNETRQDLADILYLWSAQSSLPTSVVFRLAALLSTLRPESEAGEGSPDRVTLALVMALLGSINVSALRSREDGEEMVRSMPIVAEAGALEEFIRRATSENVAWESPGLRGVVQFALAIAVTTLKSASSIGGQTRDMSQEDESLLEAALANRAFHYMARVIFTSEHLPREEFYVRYFHTIISEFITLMPLKIKELRSRADESMRFVQAYQQEGVEPPLNLDDHFEYLMLMIAELYKSDPLELRLSMEYWCQQQTDSGGGVGGGSGGGGTRVNTAGNHRSSRSPSRQVALFKFVRLAGEILPAGLFVPYLRMIGSLASSPPAARQAFNFLKPNGAGAGGVGSAGNAGGNSSGNNTGGCSSSSSSSSSTTISWDHFFTSINRYYYNLRQELPPTQDTIYRQRNHPKGITPHEVKGLEAVLNVVRTVATYDEMSRVAICDHPGWKVLPSLVGLVGCAMPIPLKAVLVSTLAALAKSPESSSTVWQSLEAAQILCTVPSTSSYQPRGVQTELEEIESRNEEYPLTRAFLELLDCLTEFPIPRLLGVGQRNPGFDPYLRFIIDTVFLRFDTRSYKNPGEKWQVAEACLAILVKLVARYEPRSEDFVGCRLELQAGETTLVNPEPGYRAMTQLHSNSELLRSVLRLIDEGRHLLDTHDSFPGKSHLEESTLGCLRILERALKTQHRYMSQLASVTNSGSSNNDIVAGLSRLLLGVNPRTGKPDHTINIASYVSYNCWLPEHACAAIGIVQAVACEPGADSELLSSFNATPSLAIGIRHGFVECLDSETNAVAASSTAEESRKRQRPPRQDDQQDDTEFHRTGDDGASIATANTSKDRVLLLLMQSIGRPAPNLAHYLLGFDITKDIRKTVIQQPGILGFPRTCLHSILGILEISLERQRDRITEACYWFLHTLVANSKTSVPVLRFLRTATNQDFVQRHLSKLPFDGEDRATELTCMSWLLKIAAIELRVAGGNLQNSLVQRLVGGGDDSNAAAGGDSTERSSPSQKLLLDLLHYIDFQLDPEPPKSWEFFDPSQIEMVLGRCSVTVQQLAGGPQLIDIRALHSLITEELAVTRGSSTATQRKLMQQELQSILSHALRRNRTKVLSYATVKFVEGWCQTTEILFSIANSQQLPIGQRQSLLLGLSHDLLRKMTSCEALNEIKTLVSGTVLVLLVNLKNSFALPAETLNSSTLLPSSPSYTTIMKIVLSHVLQWIINSGASSQKVRTHLYGALLNFLCVIGGGGGGGEAGAEDRRNDPADSTYVSQLDSSSIMGGGKSSSERSHRYATIRIINGFGDKLMDILCHNCSAGHDVCKMLALSCLDKILELDCDNAWIVYLSSRGYLRHMIDALLESDLPLRGILQPDPPTLRPLYLYEAKMATFCRMASSRLGAESLLENKLLSCLSSMTVLDEHPDVRAAFDDHDSSFVPSLGQRYQQILLPALYLCDALLTTLGTDNQSCAVQVCGFLQSHRDTVEMILGNALPRDNCLFLRQVACLTGVVARSANMDVYRLVEGDHASAWTDDSVRMDETNNAGLVDDTGIRQLRAHLYRLERLMVGLLPKFNPRMLSLRWCASENELEERVSSVAQIAANVLLYCRNQMRHTRMDQKILHLLFEPDTSSIKQPPPPPQPTASGRRAASTAGKHSSTGVPLGALVDQLIASTNIVHSELPHMDALTKKIAMIGVMSTADLKKYLVEEEENELDVGKRRMLVEKRLGGRLRAKRRTIKYLSLVLEHCLYIFWSYLDFYISQANSRYGSSRGMEEIDWRINNETLSELKQDLVAVFTDSFVAQLLDTRNEYTTVDRGFVEALVRRIKRLLQFIATK